MLKKLRSIFIIDDETPKSSGTEQEASSPSVKTTRTETRVDTDVSATVTIQDGEVNEKFLNVLLEAMEKSNLDGFDYIEFKQFLKSLGKVELDEATRFRSAFATGQTMGATKENLISSAGRYLDILKREEDRFNEAVKNQRSKLIDDKKSGIDRLEQSITAKEEQIARLNKEIEDAGNEIRQQKEELALSQAKVQQTENDFKTTYQTLIGQLKDDIEKINKYLS